MHDNHTLGSLTMPENNYQVLADTAQTLFITTRQYGGFPTGFCPIITEIPLRFIDVLQPVLPHRDHVIATQSVLGHGFAIYRRAILLA